MARIPAAAHVARYEVTVYSYGKKYFVTGRWPSAEAARKDAPKHFRGTAKVRGVKLLEDLSPANAVITEA